MRFTNGYWLIRPEFEMSYAVEWRRTLSLDGCLTVAAPAHHIEDRGDAIGGAELRVRINSPMEDVLGVELTHWWGAADARPRFALADERPAVETGEDGEAAFFRSGRLCARVSKAARGWSVRYEADGRTLTESGYRGMAHARNRETGRCYMVDSLALDVGECVYGLGERFGAFVKNGQSVDMWNADGGTCSEQAYKNVPFYLTNRGYGVFVDDTSDVSFEVASEKVERVQFSVEGERLRYFVIYGPTPKEVLDKYTRLTGRPALPPAWSFGLWLTTSFTTSYDEATTSSFIQGMAERDIPLSVFHFDCFWMKGNRWCDFAWDEETFPDPEGMLARYRARGLRICVWINPYIAQESPLFDEGLRAGYLLRRADGSVWQTDLWQSGMAVVDVTNPDARTWYCAHLERLLDMGVDCFKTDFGERIPVRGIRYADGSEPLGMHNYYTQLYNRMVFELLERKRGQGEAVLFARSATAGGQMYPAHWGGDNSACYPSMAETLRGGLSLACCGFGFWSHDISGFEQTAPADVYKRWAAFGLLSSHSRLHGSKSYRVPWLFDEEAVDVVRRFTKLKCSLMPYLYGLAVEAHESGAPMLRPMFMEYPDDPACDALDRQYMLGGDLLVAPVMHADGHVDYYLPEGLWTNLLTGETASGGRWRRETHGFMTLPLMVREGAVIPVGAVCDRPDYDFADGVTLHVYELEVGETTFVSVPAQDGSAGASYAVTRTQDGVQVETDTDRPYAVVLHADGCETRVR